MSLINKIITDLPCRFFNSTFCPESTNEDDSNSNFIVNWGAFLLTVYASIYFANRYCKRNQKQEVKKLTLQDCVNNPDNILKLQRAANGTCQVFLGQDFVIKKCGDKCGAREIQSELARTAIHNNCYPHLIIPKLIGKIGKEYLVEELLPICQSQKNAIVIYETHSSAFTPAVKEFANLLLRCRFTDLLASQFVPTRFETPIPRYDNICPYLEKGEGKLGLVDLEHFEQNSFMFFADRNYGTKIKYCNLGICITLIHLFPLHFKEIIKVMQTAGLQINEEELQTLQSAQNRQLQQRRSGQIAILSSDH